MGVWKHLAKRGVFLAVTLIVAMYLVVLIANAGGRVDEILIAQIRFKTAIELANSPAYRNLNATQRAELLNQTIALRIHARGLDLPFAEKSFTYTIDALTLNLGQAMFLRSNGGSSSIADIILERLPITVLLFTTGSVVSAIIGIILGLKMARRAMKPFDRGMTVFSISTTVVPAWIFAILFLMLFAFEVRIFPARGFVDSPPPKDSGAYALSVMYHLSLPLITWVLSNFGGWAYTTRNLVLQVMDEDFVMAARAKGLPERIVQRRYVFRAASPPIVTSLALTLIASWTGAIITETVFQWPGLGLLFIQAVQAFDATIVIGLTAIYAVLLVVTVFILDLVYSLLDPRIRAARR